MEDEEFSNLLTPSVDHTSSEQIHSQQTSFRENEENLENDDNSPSVIGNYFLQVPNLLGISVSTCNNSDTNAENKSILGKIRKRSHSVHNVQSSGDSTPTRKLSFGGFDANKRNLAPISRIGAVSSNFLNASISNIHRCSSARTLRSLFTHNYRGVRSKLL